MTATTEAENCAPMSADLIQAGTKVWPDGAESAWLSTSLVGVNGRADIHGLKVTVDLDFDGDVESVTVNQHRIEMVVCPRYDERVTFEIDRSLAERIAAAVSTVM